MRIAICGSLDFTHEIKALADTLTDRGFEVDIPLTSRRILRGEATVEQIKAEKERGVFSERAIKFDSIREYWEIIKQVDAVLVANYDKKGVSSYIGGNSFLEMGFAHVLNKPIFLLNGIPELLYSDEIKAMQPIVLEGDITRMTEVYVS
ncbi:hypothetical protein KGQ71_02055 [Patescibacteria group bacterium]|nr:hypothetical protein [Patescibacteria group bacterium]